MGDLSLECCCCFTLVAVPALALIAAIWCKAAQGMGLFDRKHWSEWK